MCKHGEASTSQEEETTETNDVTESLLHALNHAVDEGEGEIDINDDMNPEFVGKVLAENVMKQILMKSTLYEPLKVANRFGGMRFLTYVSA